MKLYNTKKIISETMTEYIINLDSLTAYDYTGRSGYRRRKFEELSEEEQEESLRRQERYYKNKIYEVGRVIDCNYNKKSVFLTLTFAENLQDIKTANNEFKLFMKRLNYYLQTNVKGFKLLEYIATWELQQRGAIHYHLVLFNFPFVEARKIEEIWGNGFIKVNIIENKKSENKKDKSIDNVASYITKYFTKDLESKIREKKAYFSSKGLKRPQEHKKRLTDDEINEILIDDKDILYQKEFECKTFSGMVGNKKTFEIVRKIYIKKRIKKNSCKPTENMVNLKSKNKHKKKLNKLTSPNQ